MKLKVLLFAFIVCGCTKDEFDRYEWGIEPELSVSPLAVLLTPSHPCDTVSVQTNYLSFRLGSVPSWLKLEKIEGYPAFIVKAEEVFSKNENKREAYVEVTVKRGKHSLTKTLVVVQFKNDIKF